MMHFGGIQKDSFEMMDLDQYISFYGRRSLNNFLKDKDANYFKDKDAITIPENRR